MRSRLSILPFAFMVLFVVGCSKEKPRGVTASGQVLVGDSPLTGAVVTLEPIAGTRGPNASAPVFGGQFEIGTETGLSGGKYRVRIAMMPPEIRSTIPADAGYELPPSTAVIDPSFDANSRLACDLDSSSSSKLQFTVHFLK